MVKMQLRLTKSTHINLDERDSKMSNETTKAGLSMTEEEREEANKDIVKHLQTTLKDGRRELGALRGKLSFTYVVIVVLSIVMFVLGIVLLSVPVAAAFGGRRIEELQSLIAAGFGIADLSALFLFRPLERIHGIMGDMSQITIAVNSFQTQVGLRLLEMDKDNRQTVGKAAERISMAAKDSIKLIQDYFEATGTKS